LRHTGGVYIKSGLNRGRPAGKEFGLQAHAHYGRLPGKEAGSKEFGLEAGITAGCQAKRQATKNLV
jgi:hypothetical protein